MYNEEILGMLMASLATIAVISVVLTVLMIIAWWKIFNKAGEKGWKAIIPFYGSYTMYKVSWKTSVWWIMLAVSIVCGIGASMLSSSTTASPSVIGLILYWAAAIALFVIQIIFCVKLAKSFGKGGGFAVGLIFLNIIFVLILAFGNAQYIGPEGVQKTE